MKVLGMKKELYMKQTCEGGCGDDFIFGDKEEERHKLYLEEASQLYELLLYTEEEECGSGWCCSEYGKVELKKINELPIGMLKSKIDKEFDMVNQDMDRYHCDLFSFDIDGGDPFYPMGKYIVHESLFEKTE
jgi:hypothetical protein